MPWMNADNSIAGSSVTAMSGIRFRSSLKNTAISRRARFAHQLTLAVGVISDQIGHQPSGAVAHRLLDSGHYLRSEGAAHDVAQPTVARIIQGNHRTEVLSDLGRWSLMVTFG